jgi:hypothetical protein
LFLPLRLVADSDDNDIVCVAAVVQLCCFTSTSEFLGSVLVQTRVQVPVHVLYGTGASEQVPLDKGE